MLMQSGAGAARLQQRVQPPVARRGARAADTRRRQHRVEAPPGGHLPQRCGGCQAGGLQQRAAALRGRRCHRQAAQHDRLAPAQRGLRAEGRFKANGAVCGTRCTSSACLPGAQNEDMETVKHQRRCELGCPAEV